MSAWRVLLLGGTTASGKSTTGRLLSRALGIPCLSADSVWRALLASTTAETHPALHQWPRPEVVPDDPEQLLKVHIQEAETMAPALEAFINWEMKEGNRFIFQGAWMTPEFAARRRAVSDEVRAVFIDEPLESDIMASILERSNRTEPDARQLIVARVGLALRQLDQAAGESAGRAASCRSLSRNVGRPHHRGSRIGDTK